MDWARDHLGNDVPAWQGGMSGFGLTCPSCGEPVRRRAGGERRPHFAHYSHRAKPDCENYYPTTSSVSIAKPGSVGLVAPSRPKRDSLSCGLFLAAEPGRTAPTLWLRIPSVDLERTATGRIEIQSGLGYRAYRASELTTARLVPLVPQVPLATVSGFGDLLPLAAEVAGQVGAFSYDQNLFYADEKGGRFIFSDEPLEWGTRYRVLSAFAITPPLELCAELKWRSEGRFGGWHCYEMALPSTFQDLKPGLHKKVAEFLSHRIRNPRPRLFVVDPFPHHVEVGGSYVYPALPDSVLLRRSAKGVVSVAGSIGAVEAHISEHGEEWVRVENVTDAGGEYTIAIDGNEQIILRVEACALFRPGGISVVTDELSWDLCLDAPVPATVLAAHPLSIACGTTRVATHFWHLNDAWVLEDRILTLPSGPAKSFYGGSFGELRGLPQPALAESDDRPVETPPAQQSPTTGLRRLVEQLVFRQFGAEGVSCVRRFLANPIPENFGVLGPIMTSRLMPYIQALQHQHCELTE